MNKDDPYQIGDLTKVLMHRCHQVNGWPISVIISEINRALEVAQLGHMKGQVLVAVAEWQKGLKNGQ